MEPAIEYTTRPEGAAQLPLLLSPSSATLNQRCFSPLYDLWINGFLAEVGVPLLLSFLRVPVETRPSSPEHNTSA